MAEPKQCIGNTGGGMRFFVDLDVIAEAWQSGNRMPRTGWAQDMSATPLLWIATGCERGQC